MRVSLSPASESYARLGFGFTGGSADYAQPAEPWMRSRTSAWCGRGASRDTPLLIFFYRAEFLDRYCLRMRNAAGPQQIDEIDKLHSIMSCIIDFCKAVNNPPKGSGVSDGIVATDENAGPVVAKL